MPDNTQIFNGTGDTMATDLITDGGVANNAKAERIKNGWGPDSFFYDVQYGQGLPSASDYTELTGSSTVANTDAIASTDVRQYRWMSLHITSAGSGATIALQGSNNAVTWFNYTLAKFSTYPLSSTQGVSATGLWVTPVHTRYIRVRPTALTSGTVTAILELSAMPGALPLIPTDVPTAQATSGAGVAAAAVMGYDPNSSTYTRLQAESGILVTRPQGLTSTTPANVAGATSSQTLAASNTSRRGLTVYNDTTGTNALYVLMGSPAATTSFTVKLGPGGYWEMPTFNMAIYTGAVTGIWDSAAGNARVTEL